MISNQILQHTIEGIKGIAKVELSVVDADGKTIATTMQEAEHFESAISEFVKSSADSQEIQGHQFFKIYDDDQLEYILVSVGAGENAYLVGKMATFQLQNLLVAYKERFDKDNFIKNLLLDNLLLVDIYSRSKKLYIQTDVKRAVLIVEREKSKDVNTIEEVRSLIVNTKDFVTAVDENSVVVVKELADGEGTKEIHVLANKIAAHITGSHVSIGTVINEIKEVSRSYKEAKMAMDVGKIFFDEREVVAYSELGIGRLIYQLPLSLCTMFIREIFGDKSPDNFDEETLNTIHKFFENSLNVSETSRQLYIHRNTLVYRLDKLQKTTNLDLRVFEDAITFKIALMVVKYMKYMESFEY